MTVLYIIDYVTQGGAIHSFLEMVLSLKSHDVRPIVITSKYDKINNYLNQVGIENYAIGHLTVLRPLLSNGIKGHLRILKYGLLFYLAEWKAFKRIFKLDLSKVDLIHTNSARNDIGCYINKRYAIPHVMHIREFADSDFDCVSFRPNYISLFNQHTDKFIAISNAVKKHWVRKGLAENKIKTIYNGISYMDITESTDESKLEQFNMIIVGGVVETKGQYIAVQALNFIPQSIRNHIKLDIAGWGNGIYIKKIEKYANEKGYASCITFLGSVDDVHERLGNYQVGLMCSKSEGFGRVTAEYMHAQLGVIASDSGANPELIEDGVNGLLFKSGDAKSLADSIMRLYNDRDLLIRLSHEAKEKARAIYTQQRNAKEIYKVYQEILKSK